MSTILLQVDYGLKGSDAGELSVKVYKYDLLVDWGVPCRVLVDASLLLRQRVTRAFLSSESDMYAPPSTLKTTQGVCNAYSLAAIDSRVSWLSQRISQSMRCLTLVLTEEADAPYLLVQRLI